MFLRVFILASSVFLASAVGWAPDTPPRPDRISTVAYGPGTGHHLDLYLPEEPGPYPVIVWLHGGGWVKGSRSETFAGIQDQVRRGWAVASVDYSLAADRIFPAPLWDVKRAVRFLKAGARDWDLDADRIVIGGSSAGGHLAALAGTTAGIMEPDDLPPDLRAVDSSSIGVINLAGPTDLSRFWETGSIAQALSSVFLGCRTHPWAPDTCPTERLRAASPITWLDPDDPPAYLAFGAADVLCRPDVEGTPLATAWRSARRDGNVVLDIVPERGHNLIPDDVAPGIERFLSSL